jgi:hypothetical protein
VTDSVVVHTRADLTPYWRVLGIPRLHALLATGNIISKTAAGEHAIAVFPAYADLCARAVKHRSGDSVTFTAADATQTVSFGHEVITSALNL